MKIKNEQESIPGYRGMYLERSGEDTNRLIDALLGKSEFDLAPEEKSDVYKFEKGIAGASINSYGDLESTITGYQTESETSAVIFAEAFLDGSIDMRDYGSPVFESTEDVYAWVAVAVSENRISPADLKKLLTKSSDNYKSKMASSLIEDNELSSEDIAYTRIVTRPIVVLEQTRNSYDARNLLLKLREEYREGGNPKDGAKRAIVDIYLARINELIAKSIPTVDTLIEQSILIGDVDTVTASRELLSSNIVDTLDIPETRSRLFKRLDYVRNGMGIDQFGHANTISSELEQDEASSEAIIEGQFTADQQEALRSEYISVEVMKKIFSKILNDADILSSEDSLTWTEDRKSRAADNLFQVVENTSGDGFAVDSISGVYKVSRIPRSIYDVMLIGGFHELTHINQAQAAQKLEKTLRIVKIGGKRVSMLKEGGANTKQRQAEKKYFGKSKPIMLTYTKALEVLQDGGDIFEATRVFFDQKRQAMPDEPIEKIAKEAADRVLRLIGQGGQNSQALVYAEEGIMQNELVDAPTDKRSRATLITSLDLVDQVRLHRYNLLPDISEGDIDWTPHIMKELEPYINNAIGNEHKE